jgi:hypothetical protein
MLGFLDDNFLGDRGDLFLPAPFFAEAISVGRLAGVCRSVEFDCGRSSLTYLASKP